MNLQNRVAEVTIFVVICKVRSGSPGLIQRILTPQLVLLQPLDRDFSPTGSMQTLKAILSYKFSVKEYESHA